MTAALRGEIYRLTRWRSAHLLLLLAPLGAAARAALGHPEGSNGFGPLADGLEFGTTLLVLTAGALSALSWVRDREHGTLALARLLAPPGVLVGARALVWAAFAAVGFAAVFAAAAGAAAGRFGLTDVVEEGFVLATAGELWGEVLRGAAAALPGLFAVICFGLLVSTLSAGPGGAVGGALGGLFVLDVLGGLFPDLGERLFVTYVPLVRSDSPLHHLTQIARAYSDAEWLPGELRRAVLVPFGTALCALVLAWLAARRRAL